MPRRSIAPVAMFALAVAVTGLLAGCVDGGGLPGPTPPTSTATASPTASPSASPTGTPASPIEADCATLVPLQALYDLDPNLALLDDPTPTGALAADAVAAGGVACTLMHTTTGETIELAVSAPGSVALAAARSSAGDAVDAGIAGVETFTSAAGLQGFTAVHRYSAESATADPGLLAEAMAIPAGVLG